jgi:Glycosyl hydrolase family 26
MKKLSLLIAIALAIVALTASPAFAAKLKVSASAKQHSTHKVVFTAKLSRPGRVKVTVYRYGHAVRKLSAYRSGSSYKAAWSGSSVVAGVYSYRVTATANRKTRTARGTVVVAVPPKTTNPPTATTTTATAGGTTGGTTTTTTTSTTTTSTGTGSSTGTSTSTGGSTSTSTSTGGSTTTAPRSGRWVGLYVTGAPSSMAPLTAAESVMGGRSAVVHFFVSDSESFPTARCQSIADHGSIPLVTLEFWSIGSTGLSAINNGSKDAYIKKFADAAKAYGGEIRLRPFHEMNGNWYPWGGTMSSNSASQLVTAWKRVHDIFAAEGATNVKFVWCPNNDSVPNTTANKISAFWPGDAYVDYVAIDGYNAGTSQSWSSWRLFSSVFSASYATVTGLTAKPLFIAETSSVEQGGSKAAWISDMFSVIPTKFPRITGVCWFDANQSYDWRIESSSASASACKAACAKGF